MKNKMPLDGLGLGHDSGSVHCDMLKMLCFRTAWGGGNCELLYFPCVGSRCSVHEYHSRKGNSTNNIRRSTPLLVDVLCVGCLYWS